MFLDAPICHPWYNGGGLDMLTDATGLRGVIAKFPRVGPLLQALMDQVRCRARCMGGGGGGAIRRDFLYTACNEVMCLQWWSQLCLHCVSSNVTRVE